MSDKLNKYSQGWKEQQPKSRESHRPDDVDESAISPDETCELITYISRVVAALAIIALIVAGVVTLASRNSQRSIAAPAHSQLS